MTQTSREKLNQHHLLGNAIMAAFFAVLTGSPAVFIVIAAALTAVSIKNGNIRLGSRPKR